MDNKIAQNGKHDGVRSVYLALYFIGALLSGVGGNFLWLRTTGQETVAPDRFTGTQAATLISKVEHLTTEMDRHITRHPDQENQFDRRIATLEAQYAIILANQGRILDRIDRLNGAKP